MISWFTILTASWNIPTGGVTSSTWTAVQDFPSGTRPDEVLKWSMDNLRDGHGLPKNHRLVITFYHAELNTPVEGINT